MAQQTSGNGRNPPFRQTTLEKTLATGPIPREARRGGDPRMGGSADG
jgi:hypothetical protein